jgi:lysozyme
MSLRDRLIAAGVGGAVLLAGVLAGTSEGARPHAYRDPLGIPTVCYGHTAGVHLGDRYTAAGCDALLVADLRSADAEVSRLVHVPINDGQRAALVDFVFNVGAGRLAGSNMLRRLNAGDAGWCTELSKWVHAGGEVLPGLVERRRKERALCEGKSP